MLHRCDHCGRVYSDRARPPDPGAAPCPICGGPLPAPLTAEERFAVIEHSLARLRHATRPAAQEGAGWWLLTFGQVASALVCAAVAAGAALYLFVEQPRLRKEYEAHVREQTGLRPGAREEFPAFPDQTVRVLLGAAASCAYAAAMVVVFTRVKRLPPG